MHRGAIRAIIIPENHILLVHSNRGDYKFPGLMLKKPILSLYKDKFIREVAF